MSSEWVDVKFSEVAKLTTGKLDSNAAVLKGGYPFFTCAPETSAIDSYAFDMEAVLLAGNNANANFPIKYYKGKFNAYQRTYVIDSKNPDKLRTKFLFYALESSLRELKKLSVGSATKFLTKVILENLDIKLPSIAEQDVILELLGSIDDRISLLRETNATLEAIAQALFKSWFVDFDPVHANAHARAQNQNSNSQAAQPNPAPHAAKAMAQNLGLDAATAALFPDHFQDSDLGPIPAGWRVGTLADLAQFQNGYAFKSKDWQNEGHPVVKIGDVKPGFIDFSGCSFVSSETVNGLDRFKLQCGDLLVGMTGYVGETGLVPTVNPTGYINQRVGRLATANGIKDLGVVYCTVRDPAYKLYAESQSQGSAQANVSGTALLSYPVVLPNQQVINRFNEILEGFIESMLSNHEQAQTLTQLRDTLLPRLISGQLRLPDAEAQIEAVVGGA